MSEPEIGSPATAQLIVAQRDLASALLFGENDEFPEVFATSRMIALMQVAAARVLRPHLGEGELSVGAGGTNAPSSRSHDYLQERKNAAVRDNLLKSSDLRLW